MNKRLTKTILAVVYIIGILALLWTVILSGYNYRFDGDELFNANTIYLMIKGYKPYVDFYTVYSPILHWLLTPVFLIFGFTFKSVSISRGVMIVFFLIRNILMYLMVKKIFGKKTALIFLPLLLLDPFTVFTGMQIRPENLMMVFYMASLLSFTNGIEKQKGRWFLLSGILLGTAFITNIKAIPSFVAWVGVFALACFGGVRAIRGNEKYSFANFLYFINGFCIVCLIFFSYFLFKGYVQAMFLHVFLDPVRLNNSIPYPTTLNYFYFTNPVIYGQEGKTPNWIYALILPIAAFAGGYKVFSGYFTDQKNSNGELMKTILFLSLAAQWLSMPFVNSVYIQYYIALNWLYVLFTAVLINDILFEIQLPRIIKNSLTIFIFVLLLILYRTSLSANIARSKMDSSTLIAEMNSLWARIPQNIPTFPNLIFRPPVYPVLWGSTFAKYMRDRYPPLYKALESKHVQILTNLNDEYLGYVDEQSQSYILSHYKRDPADSRFWIRNQN